MADSLELAIKLNVDAKRGESNLSAFREALKKTLAEAGHAPQQIQMLEVLARQVQDGKRDLASISSEYRKTVAEIARGTQANTARDALGVRSHAAIGREIEQVRAAYAQLRSSGVASTSEIAQAALRAEQQISALTEQTNGWRSALMAARGEMLSIVASAAPWVLAGKQAIAFESGMAGVAKVVDGAQAEIDGLADSLKKMAQTMPVAGGLSGLTEIAQAGGQMGIPIGDMETFIRLSVEMSNAFRMSAAEAGDAMARMMNVMGVPLSGVEALGDAINGLGNSMATNERAIVESMTRVGGTARAFGLAADQAAALSAAMNALGMSPQVAATAMDALLSRLQTVSRAGDETRLALAAIGVDAIKLGEDIRARPQAALLEFLQTLKTLDGPARTATLLTVFGRENASEISRLVSGLSQYEKALATVGDKAKLTGAMHAEFQRQLENTDSQLMLVKQNFQVLFTNVGELLLPLVKAGARLASVAAELAAAAPHLSAFVAGLATVALSISGLRLAFRALAVAGAQAFGGMLPALRNLATAIAAATAGLSGVARVAAGARVAVAAIGGPFGLLITALGLAATAWDLFGDKAQARTADAAAALLDLSRAAGDAEAAFAKLGAAERAATLDQARQSAEAAREAYKDLAKELYAHADDELPGFWGGGAVGEAKAALEVIRNEARRAASGAEADFGAMTRAIENAGNMSAAMRRQLIALVANLERQHGQAEAAADRTRLFAEAAREADAASRAAATGIAEIGKSLSGVDSAGAISMLARLKRQVEDAADQSTLGRVSRDIRDAMKGGETFSDATAAELKKYAAELDRIAASKKKASAASASKADPWLQQQESLTRKLAEAEQRLADARAGVDASTRREQNARALWLATSKEAARLTDTQVAALMKEAEQVDALEGEYAKLAEAKARSERIRQSMASLDIDLMGLEGDAAGAAYARIEAAWQPLLTDLKTQLSEATAAGLSDGVASAEAGIAKVTRTIALQKGEADLSAVQRQIERINALRSQQEQEIATNHDVGLLTDVEAQEQLLALNRQYVAQLQQMRPLLVEMAKQPTAAGEAAKAALAALDDQMKRLSATTSLFEGTVKTAVQNGLNNAIQGLVDGTMNLRDAIHALASQIVQSLAQMYAQNAVQHFMKGNGFAGLLGAMFGSGAAPAATGGEPTGGTTAPTADQSGVRALVQQLMMVASLQTSAAAAQTSAAAVQTAAGTLQSTAATVQSTAGVTLTSAATAQTAAAGALQAGAAGGAVSGGGGFFSSLGGWFGKLFGFAEGGYTGPGPKYQPAGLVHAGEFVITKDVTSQPGMRRFLEQLNRYGSGLLALRPYANGGFVQPIPAAPALDLARGFSPQAAPGGNSTNVENRISLNLIDDPQRIASVFKTRAGEEALSVLISRNPAKFRQLLRV